MQTQDQPIFFTDGTIQLPIPTPEVACFGCSWVGKETQLVVPSNLLDDDIPDYGSDCPKCGENSITGKVNDFDAAEYAAEFGFIRPARTSAAPVQNGLANAHANGAALSKENQSELFKIAIGITAMDAYAQTGNARFLGQAAEVSR